MERNVIESLAAAISAFGADSQNARLLRFDFPRQDGPDAVLLVNRLQATEEVSRDFRFEAELLSDSADIPLVSVLGLMATVSLVRADGSLRYFNGYVTEFRQVRADGGFAFYKMILEPWLAFSRYHKNSLMARELPVTFYSADVASCT